MSDVALFWANGYIIIFISLIKPNMNTKKNSLRRMLYGTLTRII